MKKIYFLIFVFISNCLILNAQSALDQFNIENANNSTEKPIKVSLRKLYNNPDKYNGKVISVTGFMIIEFERTAIYDIKNRNRKNKTNLKYWLIMSKKDIHKLEGECTHKYTTVIGQFNRNIKGHFGMFNGSIMNIRNIELK